MLFLIFFYQSTAGHVSVLVFNVLPSALCKLSNFITATLSTLLHVLVQSSAGPVVLSKFFLEQFNKIILLCLVFV